MFQICFEKQCSHKNVKITLISEDVGMNEEINTVELPIPIEEKL